uniref:Small ribosomal subunit protein uS3m n=1 Tax=Pneumocystis canis TaxID=2698477 RepID=A0A8A6W5R5_9ASCO|nr:hypothetical protein [Pneumocystis canis]
MSKIINLYFERLGLISNPRIKTTNNIIYITFYYYYLQVHKYRTQDLQQLEQFLNTIYNKIIIIKAIPLKYPFLDSKIFAKYLVSKKDPLRVNLKRICKFTKISKGIPKYLSGIEIQIKGRNSKNSTRAVRQYLTIGTKTKYRDHNVYKYQNSNGSNTLSITLYSTPFCLVYRYLFILYFFTLFLIGL